MKSARVAAIGAVLSFSGLLMAPVSAGAATTQGVPLGTASAAALSVSVAPQLLLNVPQAILDAIPRDPLGATDALKSAVSGGLKIQLDASQATGQLNAVKDDLVSASAQSTALRVDLAGLDPLLSKLRDLLDSLVSNAAIKAVGSLQQQLADQISALTGVTVNAPISGLISNLSGGINLNKTISAILDLAHPNQAVASGDLVNFSNLPLQGQLAPYHADAVNNALASANHLNGAQAYADNTTTALSVAEGLHLGNIDLGNLNSIISTVQGLITTVTATLTNLQTAVTTLTSDPNQPVPALLSGLGLTGAIAPVTNAGGQALTALKAQVATVTAQISTLTGLVNQIKGLTGLDLGNIGLADLLSTHGVTSTALVQPLNKSGTNGVHSIATSKFVDVQVVNLLGSQLSQLTGGKISAASASSLPLLDLQGLTSSAEAYVDGKDTSAPTATSGIGTIKVLGGAAGPLGAAGEISPDALLNGTQQVFPVGNDTLGWLTLTISRGAPQVINNSVTRKSVQISPLEISLVNGTANGGNPLLKGSALAAGGGQVLDISVVPAAADAGTDVVQTADTSNPGAQPLPANATPANTGLFGPWALVAGGALMLLAIGIRLAPAVAGRIRGVR